MLIEIVLSAMLWAEAQADAAPKGRFFGDPQEQEFGRWRLIQDGLEGGTVISLQFVDQDTVLAGTNVGAFRSTDGGMTWSPSRTGLPEQSGTAIAADPNDPLVYFAGGNRGVFRSMDGGATWLPANTGIEFEQIRSVAVDPSDSDHVYAAPADDRFFFSTDGGDTWNASSLGLSGGGGIEEIAVDPVDGDVVYVAIQAFVAFGNADQGVYKSVNGGMTFSPMNNGLALSGVQGFEAIVVDRNDRNRLFAGASCGGVFRSVNAGASWTRVENTSCVSALAMDPSDSQRILSNAHVSLDGGDTWQPVSPFSDTVVSVAIQPISHTLFAGGEEIGLARSLDDGDTWSVFSSGLDAGTASDILALDRDRLFAAVHHTGIFASTDGGKSWERRGQRFDTVFSDIAAAPSDQDVIYVGTNGDGVIASFDGGVSWQFRNTGIETEAVTEIAVAPNDPLRAYAATSTFESFLDGTVYVTDDGGMSWTRSGLNANPSGVEVQAIAVNPLNAMQVFAGIADDNPSQAVLVSNDGSQSWSPTDTSIDTGNGFGVFAIAIDPKTPTTLYAATAGPEGVFKSIDSGGSWTPLAASGDTLFDLAIHPVDPNRLFNSDGLLSIDGGATWTTVEPNYPFHQSVSMNPADTALLYNPGFFGVHLRNLNESLLDVPEPDDIDFGDRFGSQVVVADDLIIIGSPGSDDRGTDSGVVNVYRRVGPQVVFDQKIRIPDNFTATNFGAALALDGNRLVVGAPSEPGTVAKGNTLQAAIFERLSGNWSFKQPLTPSAGSPDDAFGSAVAVDQGMIMVGAPGDSQAGSGAGAVYVYDFSSVQATEMDKLMPPAESDGAGFGTAVGVAGGKVAVGAPGARAGQVSSGVVSLYDLISGNLQDAGDVSAPAPAAGDAFGTSVALTGEMLVIGSPGADGVVADTGSVAIYEFSGSNVVAMGQVSPTVADSGSDFGRAVAFDGSRLVVGAPMGRSATGRPGAAFLFDAAGGFVLNDQVVPDDETSLRFGFSVAVGGNEIAVGAPFSNSESGSALVIGSADRIFADDFEN